MVSRHDISLIVGLCTLSLLQTRGQHDEFINYASRTTEHGIWSINETIAYLVEYYDANWDGRLNDRKRLTNGFFITGNNLVHWFSKEHKSFLSTTELACYAIEYL